MNVEFDVDVPRAATFEQVVDALRQACGLLVIEGYASTAHPIMRLIDAALEAPPRPAPTGEMAWSQAEREAKL